MTSKHTIISSLRALMGRDLSPREHAMLNALYPPQEHACQQVASARPVYDIWVHHISSTVH